MKAKFLKYLSELTDLPITINDENSNPSETVSNFFESYYENQNLQNSIEMLERYQNMSKSQKEGLISDCEQLELDFSSLFDFKEFQTKILKAKENCSNIMRLEKFFNIFQDNKIQSILPEVEDIDDDEFESSNPNLPILYQQFNQYMDPDPSFPVYFFLDENILSTLKKMIEKPLLEKIESIGNNIFIQYVLKGFIQENPEILFDNFMEYINSQLDEDCKERYSDQKFNQMTLADFKTEIFDPWKVSIKMDEKNSSFNIYDFDKNGKLLGDLLKSISPSQNQIQFSTINRYIFLIPCLDKISESHSIYKGNTKVFEDCPFFSFQIIENDKKVMNYINSGLNYHSLSSKRLIDLQESKFRDFTFALQPRADIAKNYISYLNLLFNIFISCKNPYSNIYDIISKYFKDDDAYSLLKSQANNSCVVGEKKEALYKLIFIIDWLKSSNNEFGNSLHSFVVPHCRYLDTAKSEFNVEGSIQLIINNRQFFQDIIDGNGPDASLEYKYVMDVQHNDYSFMVDLNSVQLEPRSKENQPIEYVKLKLIASSLNITMFESRGDFEFQKIAMKFVSRFQLCEKLKSELKLLSNYYDERAQTKYLYKLEDNENEEEEDINDDGDSNSCSLKSQISKIVNAKLEIEKIIKKYYIDSLTIFSKENLCLSYSYALKKDKENLKNIILSTINKTSIRKDTFINPEIEKICSELELKKGTYEQKIGYYFELLNDLVHISASKEIYKTPKTIKNADSQLSISSFKRRIMEKAISILNYTEYQYLPDFIFDLFFSFQQEMPNYNQILFCTKDTTINRVSCLLQFYFTSNHSQKIGASSNFKLFLIINPQDLESESSEFLLNHVRKYSSDILGQARLVILSTTQADSFKYLYRLWNINNIDNCRYGINDNCNSLITTENTESYMIYTVKPRVGKSHIIMKEISNKFEKNIYHRVIIDNTTTLTRLISLLKEAPFIEGYTTCYHLNIEGSKNEQFMMYITMLYLFGSLNDGFSPPFVLSNKCKTVFYFEFSAHPPMNEETFIKEVFPIGKYIKKIRIPEDREFFSLDEYCVTQKDGYSTVIHKQFSRKELLETYALIEIRKRHGLNKMRNDYLKGVTAEALSNERKKIMEEAKNNTKAVYDNILSLFKQDWIPDKYRNESPLISQLDDVAHVIVNLIEFIYSPSTYIQESNINPPVAIRYMALSLAFETAIINCGLPYIYPDGDEIEIDKIRLDRIKKWFDSAERLLIVTGLNFKHEDLCGVRTIQHSNRVRHKKTIADEFGIEIHGGLENLVYTPEKWKELEKDNISMLKELEAIFALKRVGHYSEFALCVSYWDAFSNEDKKELEKLTRANNEYFKQLRETKNCTIKKYPQFYPPKPTKNCKDFIDIIAHIFKAKKDLPAIADEKITTFPAAVNSIQQVVLRESLLKTYSLTLHNIELFLHIVYRIYSKLPIIMIGETGTGKTYSVNFLSEIIGPLTQLQIYCFDGGTEEDIIKEYIKSYIDDFHSKHTIKDINDKQLQLIFFFDEVNTAPCQWFIKDLVIDRFLEGKRLPDYVKFICAMNPKRQLPDVVKQRLRGLEQKHQSELSNLVYKVRQMPESFAPYLFSADAPRSYPKLIENVENYEDLSEFEKVTEKVVTKNLNVESLPLNDQKSKTGKIEHFSSSSSYCTSFNTNFFADTDDNLVRKVYSENTSIKTQLTHTFISRLNAYAGRLFIDKENGIYKDDSFMSIREPERCVHLMRWFYKKGIFEFSQNKESGMKQHQIFRKSFMLSFAVTYWLRLSDYKLDKQKECDRDMFIGKIIKKWNELIKSRDFNFLDPILSPPTFNEWINDTIKMEQQKFADLFVNDDEGLSKNDALCENIWATYISLTNNIPLWIIGRPGTSKSLAVNIVLSKLFTGRTIPNLPTLVYQTFMCSSDSRSEALLSQMSRIAEKSINFITKGSINALLLEEIGHADLSPYLPLKCLNHIIDNGFSCTYYDKNQKKTINLPITLIGLSNYKMDSAKLNRGILIIRDELSPEQKKKTALDIYSSTALSLFKVDYDKFDETEFNKFIERYHDKIDRITETYHNASKSDQFTGLRDFYGVIKLVTSVLFREGLSNMNKIIYAIKRNFSGDKNSLDLFKSSVDIFQQSGPSKKRIAEPSSLDLIRDNLDEDWSSLKNPLSRHMLIVTEGNSALSLLIAKLKINCLIYADNFSGLPDDEWISNDLKQFAKSMTSGETIVFIGNHPCFNCLYDVFNLRYESIYDESFALISFAGDSFLVKVHPHFKAIIIMEEKEYGSLPAPFLNRFEKLFLNYDSILSQDKKEASENYEAFIKGKFPDFKVNASFRSLSKAPEFYFGCYSQHHFNAITYCKDQIKLNQDEVDQLVFLNCQPSKAVVSLTKYNQKQIQYLSNILNELSPIKSSILHLLYFYNKTNLLIKQDKKGSSSSSKKNKAKATSNSSLACKLYDYWKVDKDKIPGIQATLLLPFYQNLRQEDFEPFGELIYIQLSEKINEGLIYSRIRKCMKKSNDKSKSIITLIEVQIPSENLQQRIFHLQAVFEKIRKELVKDSLDKSQDQNSKIALHTFILIEMRVWENDLSFVQSAEWPVIFLDTCVSSNLKPIENSLKTVDISSIVFNPLKNMFPEYSNEGDDDNKGKKNSKKAIEKRNDIKINMDDFLKVVRSDLLLIYNKEIRKLLSKSLSNNDVSKYLMDYFLFLISSIKSFGLCLPTSENKLSLKKDENVPWFMNFLRTLYSPPPSLIEYLSVKLARIAESIYSSLTQTILSCSDNFSPDLKSQKNIDAINFVFNSNSFILRIENSILSETPQMSQIEYRYLNPKKVLLWQIYNYMWEIVIYDPGQILNPSKDNGEEEEEEEWFEEEEDESEKVLTAEDIEKFFEPQLEEYGIVDTCLKPKTIPDAFYAAYILIICPGISVSSDDREKFDNLIKCIKLIVASVYGKNISLSETMINLLDESMKSYLATISQCFIFIPKASSIKFIKEEDSIQQNISIVAKHILSNIFDYKFKNIIDLKNFFIFGYPVIRSLSVEFNYALTEDIWDLEFINSHLNILSLYNLLFSMLPESVKLKSSMWKNKKLNVDIEKLPKTSKDIIDLVSGIMDSIKDESDIDQKEVDKIYRNLVVHYSNYMSKTVYHGFCDPELD